MFVSEMLQSLKVKNFALIDDVEIQLDPGMNVITGETGAGKSILIKALGLALGNRADTSVLRRSDKKCVVEAVFRISSADFGSFFESRDLDFDEHTILRREISSQGKSRAFINDTPVTLNIQEEMGRKLIEVHSQHDSLLLFTREFQFFFMDALAGTLEKQKDYTALYSQWNKRKQELEALDAEHARFRQESDFNQFLFDELDKAALQVGEEEELNREQELLENAEELIRVFAGADALLSNSDQAVSNQLAELERMLRQARTELTFILADRLKQLIIELNDISADIGKAGTEVQLDPERLEWVNERLSLIFELKSKHRAGDIESLLQIRQDLENKLERTSDLEAEIMALKEQCQNMERELIRKASELHIQRSSAIEGLEARLKESLAELGMKHSMLKFELLRVESPGKYGLDDLQILLSSDNGSTFNKLKQAASGGELSRINLCLKSILADRQRMQTSVFDEIDTGVSGEIAHKVGARLLSMAASQQLIAVTHLVQIASLGQRHLHISKTEEDGVVKTIVRELKGEDRIHEIAKMISGSNLTESALEQSRELMKAK